MGVNVEIDILKMFHGYADFRVSGLLPSLNVPGKNTGIQICQKGRDYSIPNIGFSGNYLVVSVIHIIPVERFISYFSVFFLRRHLDKIARITG